MGVGAWRAALTGVGVALVCVIALAIAVVTGVVPSSAERTEVLAEGPVLVALVLPDPEGAPTVRVLDLYDGEGGTLRVSSVDPLASATVPGTSATTLAEAFTFGGGDGLAAAYAQEDGESKPAWIVVGPRAWSQLMGSTAVQLELRTDIEVFDGAELYSFPAGTTSVSASRTAQLMNGAAYLGSADLKAVRESLGDALAPVIMRTRIADASGVDTNLTPEQWTVWFNGVNAQPVRADTTR